MFKMKIILYKDVSVVFSKGVDISGKKNTLIERKLIVKQYIKIKR